ncbi:retrotransposon protein [Cucumis melo var. makuwa]|nr:retrotransposon protein [Cucumis melo var. makuwa]
MPDVTDDDRHQKLNKIVEEDVSGHCRDEGSTSSDFGWNDEVKCIIVKKDLFDHWIRTHPIAKGLLNKPFSYYDELSYARERSSHRGSCGDLYGHCIQCAERQR